MRGGRATAGPLPATSRADGRFRTMRRRARPRALVAHRWEEDARLRPVTPSFCVPFAFTVLLVLAAGAPARAAHLPFTGSLSLELAGLAISVDGSGFAT